MLRHTFDQKLQILQTEVLTLGQAIEGALGAAVEGLVRQDLSGVDQIMAGNCANINKRTRLETETLSQIATQQPVAGDLRMLAAVLEITAELERMSSYAASIAQITFKLAEQPLPEPCPRLLRQMSEKARAMLRQSLQAFSQRDIILARSIPALDDEVDQLYNELCQTLVHRIKTDPSGSHQAAALVRAAHDLERTADRVLNICEWVVFAVIGEMKELNNGSG
jgi:phosphate transport system protein